MLTQGSDLSVSLREERVRYLMHANPAAMWRFLGLSLTHDDAIFTQSTTMKRNFPVC